MLTCTHLIIITEHATGDTLHQYVLDNGFSSEDVARFFFKQLITAVEAMHGRGLYHRNLNLKNILIHVVGVQQDIQLQICDFGFSKHDSGLDLYTGKLQ